VPSFRLWLLKTEKASNQALSVLPAVFIMSSAGSGLEHNTPFAAKEFQHAQCG
jgi:hypothetical protein